MSYFVRQDSVVREIWGKSDTILFIFAGSAAEFALNKAVDWLYFTGKLPADPLGRLFSTVTYARRIIFAEEGPALSIIDSIYGIHQAVERNRGKQIPGWAYRDVLYMLIHYSIASFELLERRLTEAEKQEVYDVFYRFGIRMKLQGLAENYSGWQLQRKFDMQADLAKSDLTTDLFRQYRKHLGAVRYFVLIEGQKMILPERVRQLLGFSRFSALSPIVPLYQLSRKIGLDNLVKKLLLPHRYESEIRALDVLGQNKSNTGPGKNLAQ